MNPHISVSDNFVRLGNPRLKKNFGTVFTAVEVVVIRSVVVFLHISGKMLVKPNNIVYHMFLCLVVLVLYTYKSKSFF